MLCWLRLVILLYWTALTYLLLSPDPLWFLSGTDGVDEAYTLSVPDLVQHFLVFGLLGLLLTFEMDSDRLLSLTLGVAVAYSFGTELVQLFVPGRFASALDIFANLLGLAVGWGAVQFLRSLALSRRVRTPNAMSS